MKSTKKYALCAMHCALLSLSATAQTNINFNSNWNVKGKCVTLPRAWNEEYAFRVAIEELPDDTVRYTKSFTAPKEWKDKKVMIEFEGARQSAEVWLNGQRLGLHQNGVMAFGFDLTPYIKIGETNLLEVLTDNDWSYHEKNADGSEIKVKDGVVVKDGNNLPNNELKPTSFQWNNKNFNANYGGLPKNVRLHVVPKLYQTLPLYSSMGTTGVYVYPKDIDVKAHKATVHAESEIRNETGKAQSFTYKVEIKDKVTGEVIATFSAPETYTIEDGATIMAKAEKNLSDLHFWSWGYGYLYDVKTMVCAADGGDSELQSEVITTTGFRKTAFEQGQTKLNDCTIMMHGYAQRTSNEWPGVGMSVPAWLSDFSNGLIVESGGNLVRWMHVCPWKQDIESCDRVGLIQAMPAGDAEKDVTGRHWEQRVELMRDAIIYNRNNPSILFYECGNKGISEEHMQEMKSIRDQFDPHGGRAIGCREMLNNGTTAEYGGEMLYINKSATKPVWAMEYCRDEALRKYWDDWSYPYHKQGVGPLYRNADASAYNQNNDQFAIEMVRRWYDYWQVRPGTGKRISNGGVKIVFSDTNTHNRGESNYRTSGVVDAMRLPKDAFYAHQVMWDGWVDPDSISTHIIGHWNYDKGTVKPVYVISNATNVKLLLNGKEVGKEKVEYGFLHTFDSIQYKPGTLSAVVCNDEDVVMTKVSIQTAGKPHHLNVKTIHAGKEKTLGADGADMMLIEYEVVDAKGRRCPTANNMVHFRTEGPIEWIGGIAMRDSVNQRDEWEKNPNCIRSLDLPVECGVNRALIRSTGGEGTATIAYEAEGIKGNARGEIKIDVTADGAPDVRPRLTRGETPEGASYINTKGTVAVRSVVAGCNQEDAIKAIDDSEDTEWKNDGRSSTAWIRFELEKPSIVNVASLKMTGWRRRSYPIEIYADSTLVWSGSTEQSLGYVHLELTPTPQPVSSITIRLKGSAKDEDAYGAITELAAPVANELDLFKAKDGDKVNAELRIVEADFLQWY